MDVPVHSHANAPVPYYICYWQVHFIWLTTCLRSLTAIGYDYCLYGFEEKPEDPRDGAREVVRSERRMNWDVLLNEHRIIERDSSKIAIVGVENTGKWRLCLTLIFL